MIQKRRKIFKYLIICSGIAASIFLIYYLHKPADLRDESIRANGIQQEQEIKGRRLLQQMAEVHGDSIYKTFSFHELTFSNTWGYLPGLMYRPWVENGQKIRMTCRISESFNSETLFLDGNNRNEIWGVSNRKSYTKKDVASDKVYKKDDNIELWLTTFQFLFEIPFRTEHLHYVSYMGIEQIGQVSYHKVFATWLNIEPSNDYDQIVFYINTQNLRLEKLHYTCRDSGFGFFSATINFEDYINTNGILEPQSQTITFGGPKTRFFGHPIILHEIAMKDVARYY